MKPHRLAFVSTLLALLGACTTPEPVSTAGALTVDAGAQPVHDAGVVTKKGPPYPIVLAHGFFGFEAFAGIDYVRYFFNVKEALARSGEKDVFTPTVDPFNDSRYRGHQLVLRIEAILKETGHAKVNIIGHSQGGLDARAAAFERPDLVASVVTLGTPHGGTPLSDLTPSPLKKASVQAVVDELVRLVGAPLWDELSKESALSKPLALFTKEGIAKFNAEITDRPGVSYFSIAGRTALQSGGDDCQAPNAPKFISEFNATLDLTNPLLKSAELYVGKSPWAPIVSDAFVRVNDGKWGTFLGCIPADHLDQVGQLIGEPAGSLWGKRFDHEAFFQDLVRYLRSVGY